MHAYAVRLGNVARLESLNLKARELGAWVQGIGTRGSQHWNIEATYSCLTPTVQHFPGGLEAMLLDFWNRVLV